MTSIDARAANPVQRQNQDKQPSTDFLAQLQLERTGTGTAPAPATAPAQAPGGTVRPGDPTTFGGRGIGGFPGSNFDEEAGSVVALLDVVFQGLGQQGQPMILGGVSVQEYGLIRARLENPSDTLEGMAKYQDDMAKLYRMIDIAGGEGMAVPDDIEKLLKKWREQESDPLMSQQPNDIPGLTRSNVGNVQFPSPQGPNSQQPVGGFPMSGNPVGFDTGGASGASGASRSGGGSATERQLRDLLDKIGANDPGRDVYEIMTEVIRDVIDKNAYAHPEKATAVAEIARILSTANTGYSNSSIPEFVRIIGTPEAREAHSISVELARMQPDQVTSISQNGEKAVSFLKKSDGDYVIQALKPVHLRMPNGETARVDAYQTHSVPRGSVVTVPGMSPIEIGRTPREPTVIYPSDEPGHTPPSSRSYSTDAYGPRPNPAPDVPSFSPTESSDTTSLPATELDFELPEPITESVVPDIAGMNDRYDRTMEHVRVTLQSGLTLEAKAKEVADRIDSLPPEERGFAGLMASRWAETFFPPREFESFMDAFDENDFRQPGWTGGKSIEKSEKSTSLGNEKLVGRLNRLLEVGERAGWPGEKLAVLERGIEMLAAR